MNTNQIRLYSYQS